MTKYEHCDAAFAALCALHATGFAHGDARLPNLLTCVRDKELKLVWIDLRLAVGDLVAATQRGDASTLAASILGIRREKGCVLPAPIEAALLQIPGGGAAAYSTIAAAVWEARGLLRKS